MITALGAKFRQFMPAMTINQSNKSIVNQPPPKHQQHKMCDQTQKHYSNSNFLSRKSFNKRFEKKERLGKGAQAAVVSAWDTIEKHMVALKIFKKKEMTQKELEVAYQEKYFIETLKHPNLPKYYGCFEDRNSFIIITDLMNCDMRMVLNNLKEPMKEWLVRSIFYQMVISVDYIHSKKMIHRDIKLENFLINQNSKSGKVKISLTDFGLACNFDPKNPPKKKCGTMTTIAPEVINEQGYNQKADCWSLGVILIEMLSGQKLIKNGDVKIMQNEISNKDLDFEKDPTMSDVSSEAIDLLNQIMERDPQQRLSTKQMLKHPWFQRTNK